MRKIKDGMPFSVSGMLFVVGFCWLKEGFGKCEMTKRGRHPARNKEAP